MEFKEFPKMARLSRDIIITEKIDGTNASICITIEPLGQVPVGPFVASKFVDGGVAVMRVGSRTRWITPTDDNAGFARWVQQNSDELFKLGVGHHFGEWWGSGIQRGYGLSKGDKRFSLFNVTRWALHGTEPKQIATNDPRVFRTQEVLPLCCGLVPLLYEGPFNTEAVEVCLDTMRSLGSAAAPGFMKPEGVVVFHTAANVGFKKTLERDDVPKSLVKKQEAVIA